MAVATGFGSLLWIVLPAVLVGVIYLAVVLWLARLPAKEQGTAAEEHETGVGLSGSCASGDPSRYL
ncbi:MAG: hypothetical protein HY660_17855 [Armatimonadetes bacterium]|nr:hypothetical protein [Armatimonadota bacterium]